MKQLHRKLLEDESLDSLRCPFYGAKPRRDINILESASMNAEGELHDLSQGPPPCMPPQGTLNSST